MNQYTEYKTKYNLWKDLYYIYYRNSSTLYTWRRLTSEPSFVSGFDAQIRCNYLEIQEMKKHENPGS